MADTAALQRALDDAFCTKEVWMRKWIYEAPSEETACRAARARGRVDGLAAALALERGTTECVEYNAAIKRYMAGMCETQGRPVVRVWR
jgi:hypothetical protein